MQFAESEDIRCSSTIWLSDSEAPVKLYLWANRQSRSDKPNIHTLATNWTRYLFHTFYILQLRSFIIYLCFVFPTGTQIQYLRITDASGSTLNAPQWLNTRDSVPVKGAVVTIPSGTYSISAEDDNGNPLPVGVVLYGSGTSESYGFPAGLQLAAINVNIPYCSSTILSHAFSNTNGIISFHI